jgi:hypothetical protein
MYIQILMQNNSTTLAILAIFVAMGLVGVVAIVYLDAEAGCEKGNAGSRAFNASQGRCFHP